MTTQDSIKEYYDNFKEKLIADFLKPNRRIKNAIERSIVRIPQSSGSILDLGFGLGWSSYEFARHFPAAQVIAVDISHELCQTAQIVFSLPNLKFAAFDLTQSFPQGQFDVVVLLDVFEHIPAGSRPAFYENVNKVLSPTGKIVLTCPTIDHQQYLRIHHPQNLQPVDEDIDLLVLDDLSKAIGGDIVYFELMSMWRPHDYFIAEISRPNSNGNNEYSLSDVKLIDFYDKCALLKNGPATSQFAPDLTLKQRLAYTFKKLFT